MICIIPAAGKAERMNGIPKMLLPVHDTTLLQKLICKMRRVESPRRLRIGTRTLYGEMLFERINEGGVIVYNAETATMSETVLLARDCTPGWEKEPVMLGLPDAYFEDEDVFPKLAAELRDGADVAVACFRTRPEQRHKLGMVDIGGCEVLRVEEKPAQTTLEWAWGALARMR